MLLMLLSRMDKTKFTTVVILPNEGPLLEELQKLGIKVVIAPVLKVYRDMFRPKNLFAFFKDMKKAMAIVKSLHKEHSFDIVYSNTLAVLLGMIFAKRGKVRHVWHVHEIIVHPKAIAKAYPYLLKNFSDTIICNSYATKDNLVTRINALESKCVVVHNGLDIRDHVTPGTDALPQLFPDKSIVITLVGRISRLKGHKWLLDTYCTYLKDTNAKLLFVGSPVPGQEHYLHEVEDIIREQQLEDRVKVLPFMKELAPVWEATDIAVMPSTEAESFGLVALEAMLAKKPVVGSRHGGLTEIIIDNRTGFLIEPGNSKELAQALETLMTDEHLRDTFGKNGRERAIAEFSVDSYVASISSILDR
jgi:glycosyltransferase involved in cell wall biosynthesis